MPVQLLSVVLVGLGFLASVPGTPTSYKLAPVPVNPGTRKGGDVPRPANEDRKPEILEATCRMIAREGVHNFTMGQVAKEAGISRALIAYYFQTRGELLRDALGFAE